jgi:uncharacterized repeat protein (TIGR03803 family)
MSVALVDSLRRRASVSVLTIALALVPLAASAQVTVVHSFNRSDGASPYLGTVMFDSHGNLYGETRYGGLHNAGTIFEIAGGTEFVLHSFAVSDGALPSGGLVMDAAGNLYGTTESGGKYDYGTVFKMTPAGVVTTLHHFTGPTGGKYPLSGVTFGPDGALYGTTWSGGTAACSCGLVFKVTTHSVFGIVHKFAGGKDGANPASGLRMDFDGVLLGTTTAGGGSKNCVGGCGTVYQIDTARHESVLFRFSGGTVDGARPWAALTLDGFGNMYGTTSAGYGTVFALNRLTAPIVEEVLFSFSIPTGTVPYGEMVLVDSTLFGTTYSGVVFQLALSGGEHALATITKGGAEVFGGLTLNDNLLYGMTSEGGATNLGMVYSVALPD